MPRFYFDFFDDAWTFDEVGIVLEDFQAVWVEAMSILPCVAADEIKKGSDRRQFVVLVKDDKARPVYGVTLTLAEIQLAELDAAR